MITKEEAEYFLKSIIKALPVEGVIDEMIEGKEVIIHFDLDKQKFVRLTFKDIVKAYYGLEEAKPKIHI